MLFWRIKGFMSRYPHPGTHIIDCATLIEIGEGYPRYHQPGAQFFRLHLSDPN